MTDTFDPALPGDVEMERLLRELTADDAVRHAPPADLWASIATDAGVDESPSLVVVEDRPARVEEPTEPVADNVVPMSRWRNRARPLAVAAAAVAVVVAGIVAVTVGNDDADVEIVASADLAFDATSFDPLGADAAASVNLVADDGAYLVEIAESDLPDDIGEPADLELWLLNPVGDDLDIISLGLIDPSDPGTYPVPDDIVVTEATAVDISVEPRDGVDTHSGRSILRAPLDFV